MSIFIGLDPYCLLWGAGLIYTLKHREKPEFHRVSPSVCPIRETVCFLNQPVSLGIEQLYTSTMQSTNEEVRMAELMTVDEH